MDDHKKVQYENRPESLMNAAASCDSPANSSQEKSISKSVDNDDLFNSVSEYPIYCISDSNGRLHFSLNIYNESTLNPSEQKDLGQQLHEYIRDHYDQYQRSHDQDHFEESFHSGFESFSPLVQQSLYYDFTTQYPDLNVGHETYFKALSYVSSARRKVLNSKSLAHVPQSCSIDEQRLQPTLPRLTSQEPGTPINPSASDVNAPKGEEPARHVKDGQNQNYHEREALFFNRLNICRRKINSRSPDHDRRPSTMKQSSFSLDSLSSLFHSRGQSMQHFQLHPLSSKCSCSENKCLTVFPEQERQQICKRFWCGRNSRGNLKWFGASVQRHCLPYSKPHTPCRKKRPFLIGKYFLHKPAVGRQAVCKRFFLTTLGLHFYFPLYDIMRQTAFTRVKPNRESCASNSHKTKSKKKTILKHCMKRHIRKYFLQHRFHKSMALSAIIPQIKRSFKHFTIQFPHLLDNRSFKKYLAIICKILNSKKYHSNDPVTSSSSSSISHKSKGRQANGEMEQNPAISSAHCSDGRIMKIKPEDFDEVMADDMAEKFKVATNNKYKTGLSVHQEKQSTSSVSMHSEPPAMPAISIKGRRKRPQIPLGGDNNLPVPQLCSETVKEKQSAKRPYTKRKGKAGQKKKASGKFPVKKGRPPLASHPKKIYKIAVNELEDDESKHPMLPPCNCTKSKCVSKVSEEQRHVIHAEFWGLDNISRRTWMVKHVHILKPKSRSNRATARLHKMHRKFFLPDSNGTLHDVCKKFFLGTLGFKGVGVLRPQRIPGVNSSSPQVDTRKRVLSYQVCQQDVIRVIQYCKSFNKEKNVSICVDERFTRATNNGITSSDGRHQKICVPYGFTWKELYRDYCLKHPPVDFGYQTFRSILSLVEHNNFSEDLLDKFQNLPSSDSVEISSQEEQKDTDVEQSDTSYQEQYHILRSFPKSQKTHQKPPITKEPSSSSKTKSETEKKAPKCPKHHKKLKLSKSFLSHDFTQTVKRYKERNAGNTRYNFRQGVPLVSYALETDTTVQIDDDYLSNDWEDSGYDGIKEETPSDQEKNKKVVKAVSKKRGRKPGKKKKKLRSAVATSDVEPDWTPEEKEPSPKPKTTLLDKKKKIVQRGRKKSWNLKIDMKQKESTMRFKNRHPILPPCKCNYRKCHEKIPEAQREKIHSLYWGISSKQDRCKWVLEHIQRCSPKTRSNTGLPSRKRETRRYFFPNEEEETIEVCRVFFLRTLGYQWDSVVDTVSRTLPRPGGHLAKSLGFFEEQLPYEVIVRIKTLLKRKKIRKSSITAAQFPDNSHGGDVENDEEENFTLEGYTIKDLFTEFGELHPAHVVDFHAFKQIVRFILVPGSETQSEWDIKQEQLQNAAEGSKAGRENVLQPDGTTNISSGDGNGPDGSVIYFTPEFEKIDVEKALTRKARRRRPVSSRNCKEQHPMREPCQCIRKCREKVDQRRREEIHQQYWDLITYNQRKQWILEHIKREAPKRRTNLTGPIKKMETRKFYLEDWSGKKVEICKGFFLSTLGFKWDKMVDTICKTTPRDGQYVRPDQRGKKPPSHKLSETLITSVTNYVESILETASCIYPKTPNRSNSGKQKKAPERMPYGLTMKNLFEDYKIKHPNHKVGYESFRKIYRSVIQSEKFQPISASSPQAEDEDDEPAMEQLSRPPQHLPSASMLAANMNSSSSDRTNEQDIPNFEAAPQSCMYNKNQAAMRINNQEQSHLSSYQRQCEPSVMKSFPEGINSFSKSHDVQFYSPGLEQSEEMSMQMFKSICLPSSNPNQTYSFYPNSLPLDTFHMNSGSQSLHGGLPYSESLRHSDLMHHHAYQPPAHHHFGQGRFHGFVLPGSSVKEAEPAHHHLHAEMNINPNYRNEFDCNPYPTKTPLLYPPAYPANADNMPSSSSQRHAFNNLPMQAHGMHEIRLRDSAAAAVVSTPTNQLVNDSSLSNSCHVPNSIPNTHNHQPPGGNEWGSQVAPTTNKGPHNEAGVEKKGVKRSKGRPSKRPPKEKVPKAKKEKKVRPKSNRNSREYNPMLPPCGCSVKKCLEKIPEPRREFIYNMFWDLGCYNKRKQWIAEHIVREDPKRRTSLDNPLRRMETRRFFLPNDEGEKMEVCKGFFLRTLGFKWDKMVDTICKTTEKGQTTVRPDMRGKKGPSRKLNAEVASSVESYVRSILLAAKPAYEAVADQSDEGLEQNHDKDIFVPYGLTMKNFHEDYKGKHAHHKVGYESFRKIFRRVSKEVLDSVSLREDEKGNLMPTSTKGNTHVINPITGLPQEEPE